MVQRTGDIQNETELLWMISSIKDTKTYESAKSIFVQLYFSRFSDTEAQKVVDFVHQELPKAKIAGMSLYGDPVVQLNKTKFIRFNTCLFDESDVFVFEYDSEKSSEAEIAGAFKKELSHIEDVKGVLFLVSGVTFRISDFMEDVSRGFEAVPFFGSISNINTADVDSLAPYAFSVQVISQGIIAVVFSGKNLAFYAENLFNWNAIGKPLKVETGTPGEIGDTLITKIDGLPAAQIYKKYLNVDPDSHFIANVCEFPIAVERNGCIMARVPCGYNEKGELNLMGNIKDGEEIRFTYGKTDDILKKSKDASARMAFFHPEAIFLFVCANRAIFMKDRAHEEIDSYARIIPAVSYCHGFSELFKHNGKGGVLNSQLVAVGIREGKINHTGSQIPSPGISFSMPEKKSAEKSAVNAEQSSVFSRPIGKPIPLADRLVTFLETTTDELKKAEEKANAANHAKSNFLSSMSHEIRTPINAVLGLDEMILRESAEDAIKGYARDILSSGRSLLSIINDILDFSKIEAGKIEIIQAEYDLRSVISDLTNMTAMRAQKKGLNFIVDVDPKIPHLLYGDETRIKQCALNILTNAAKYTHEGSVTFKVSYQKKDEKHILLTMSVSDTGIGIKQEDLPKLFSPFERIEESRNRNIEGTGLGMSIVTGLLSRMGTKLEVKSVYGKGSDFSFTLEQRVRDWEETGTYEQAREALNREVSAYTESFQAPNARILVVDDTPMNLTVMQGLLKSTRIQIDTALSGEAALELVRKNEYQILFIDHLMPKMDGIEFLSANFADSASINKNTPAVALTANAVTGAKEMYLEAGFYDYLSKPVDSKKLEQMICRLLPKELIILPEDKDFVLSKKDGQQETVQSRNAGAITELFSDIFNLDIEAALTNCGSKEVFLQAVKDFYNAVDEKALQIENCCASHDWKNYTVLVHALKSSARLIGAADLSETARRLEACGNTAQKGVKEAVSEILQNTPVLLDKYRSCKKTIVFLCKEPAFAQPAEKKPLITGEKLAEALSALGEVIKAFDFDSADAIITELAGYEIPEAERSRFEKIRTSVRNVDAAAVIELLSH